MSTFKNISRIWPFITTLYWLPEVWAAIVSHLNHCHGLLAGLQAGTIALPTSTDEISAKHIRPCRSSAQFPPAAALTPHQEYTWSSRMFCSLTWTAFLLALLTSFLSSLSSSLHAFALPLCCSLGPPGQLCFRTLALALLGTAVGTWHSSRASQPPLKGAFSVRASPTPYCQAALPVPCVYLSIFLEHVPLSNILYT